MLSAEYSFLQLSAHAVLPMTSIEHSHNLYTLQEKCKGRCDTFLEDARTTEVILADWLVPKKWGYQDRVSEYTQVHYGTINLTHTKPATLTMNKREKAEKRYL